MPIPSTPPSFDVFSQTRHPMTRFFTPTTLSSPVFCFLPGGFPSAFSNVLFKFSPSREQNLLSLVPLQPACMGLLGRIPSVNETAYICFFKNKKPMETSLITVVSKVISLTPHFRESPQTKALGRKDTGERKSRTLE